MGHEKGKVKVNTGKLPKSRRHGSAIVLVLLAAIIMSAMGVGLLSLGMHSRFMALRTCSEIAARCAADAGLTKALFEMNQRLKAESWDDSTLPQITNEALLNCDATFSYTVTGNIGSGYTVEVVGKSGRFEKRINCSLPLESPFESVILTDNTIVLMSNTQVDGYNSTDPSVTDVKVKIGTNSTAESSIILNSGVTVNGDLLVGPGGDVATVIKDLGATTGNWYAMSQEIALDPVTVPALSDKGTGINVHGTTLTIGPADSGKYTQIGLKRAAGPAVLQIDGGNVVLQVTGDIKLGQDCEIAIKQGASLELYLDGDLDAGNSAGINNANSPTKFKLYGTAQEQQQFVLKAKNNFVGAVYAPKAAVSINAGSDIYGAFTAKSFETKSGSRLYYDEALKNVSVEDTSVRFIVKQWGEE